MIRTSDQTLKLLAVLIPELDHVTRKAVIVRQSLLNCKVLRSVTAADVKTSYTITLHYLPLLGTQLTLQ
jgi:hypothetical protein